VTRPLPAAIVVMVFAAGAGLAAQHGPEPKAPAAKAAEPKSSEARPAAPASPLATAAAVEQILRKLRADTVKAPATRSSASSGTGARPPRLRLTWRLSLTWPVEVTPPKTAR